MSTHRLAEARQLLAGVVPPRRSALQPFVIVDVPPTRQESVSPIPGVAGDAWGRYVDVLKTAQPSAISATHALGMFELRMRRLGDLGLVTKLRCELSPLGRFVWVGDFVPPLTQADFLASERLQELVFGRSNRDYFERLRARKIDRAGLERYSLSGLLSILHRCGPPGLAKWNQPGKRFPSTEKLCEKANGLF